jgi:hypothetical protein
MRKRGVPHGGKDEIEKEYREKERGRGERDRGIDG